MDHKRELSYRHLAQRKALPMPKEMGSEGGKRVALTVTDTILVSKKLEKIKANPKAGWEISDIKTVCRQLDMICSPPTRGSHHKVSSPHVDGVLVIPHNKPIKVAYIKSFIGLAETHVSAACAKGEDHG